ncbi:MAG: thioredoxin [Lachnospiraceae bacterium]|nr:thioredoxin [Lachnospiraceae bacterium]
MAAIGLRFQYQHTFSCTHSVNSCRQASSSRTDNDNIIHDVSSFRFFSISIPQAKEYLCDFVTDKTHFSGIIRIIRQKNSRERGTTMSTIQITKDNFEQEVLLSDKPVLLDFWASWCGPCAAVSPIVEEIAEENTSTLKVGKINVDEQVELMQRFHIASIPMFIVIKDGEVAKKSIGLLSKEELLDLLK